VNPLQHGGNWSKAYGCSAVGKKESSQNLSGGKRDIVWYRLVFEDPVFLIVFVIEITVESLEWKRRLRSQCLDVVSVCRVTCRWNGEHNVVGLLIVIFKIIDTLSRGRSFHFTKFKISLL
jgi:hypothetical protein